MMTKQEAMKLAREIAAEHPECVAVAADEVRTKLGQPAVEAWRHPDDVHALEQAWINQVFWKDEIAARRAVADRVEARRMVALTHEAQAKEREEVGSNLIKTFGPMYGGWL